MFVITVIPLKRGVTIDSLTYFSGQTYPLGTILTVPIRKSVVLGLVTEVKEVSTAKTALRAATFSLKKLPIQENTRVLGEAYIHTATDLSVCYMSSVGAILYNLLPPEIRNGDIAIPHTHHPVTTTTHTPYVLQAKKTDRYIAYKLLVRETFAHAGSILIVVPTSVEADELRAALENGISDRIIMLTTACTKSEIKNGFARLEDFSKTKLIIATPSYALIERHDIMQVIIESAHSSYYKELVRPFLDYRDVLKIHAKHTGRKLLFADILLRTEEEELRREDIYQTYGEVPKRLALQGELSVIKMESAQEKGVPFALFSAQVLEAIKEVKKKKGHMFLFSARRGLAPVVTCMDCGYIFRSKESGCPYSLIRTTTKGVEERWFVCSTSGERIRAQDTCPSCGSWRLRERGIGIQHVYDELHKIAPQIPVILFDHISAKTYKKALFLRDSFYNTKGAILLGTHMAIPYLHKQIDTSAIVNMDALLATPTWRLEEENLALLLKLRDVTKDTVYVQTRAQETPLLEYVRHGSIENFYTDEIELRKNFHYPPFATFVHFTWQGAPAVVKNIETEMQHIFKEYSLSTYQHPTSTKESPIMYGLIRIPRENLPDQKLHTLIRTLNPSVRVVLNPDRVV